MPPARQLRPLAETLTQPARFLVVHLAAGSAYPPGRHNGGQFVQALSGVLEITMAGRVFLAPPQYGVWIPPGMEHSASNQRAASYATLYLEDQLCTALPAQPCTVAVSPLMDAILTRLRDGAVEHPATPAQQRLFDVLLDELTAAPHLDSFLPASTDPQLRQVLDELQQRPWDMAPLATWAAKVHTTERTLARRCLRDLGMTFNDWRQRLKVLRGIALLEGGHPVKDAAIELGYVTPSAFIAMFRRHMGMTPQEYLQVHPGKSLKMPRRGQDKAPPNQETT